ncbi:MAG: DNA polymerase III subunit delta [Saprospirales bacterium]|nr:DNA polymerase III subunit delta [Saprospirales bacterium]
MATTHQQILQSLRKKDFKPVYFLHGPEPYFIDSIEKFIEENALPEEQKAFNQIILYGKDVDANTVIDNARRFPMMAEHQVVILRESQMMRELKDLETYLKQPQPSTILVICHKHKKFTGKKLLDLASNTGVVFESKKLYENQVFDWVQDHIRSLGYDITSHATNLLIEYLGTDVSVIVLELEKLALHLEKGVTINEEHIEEYVGISREYNVFELNKALGLRDIAKVSRILQNFSANPKRNPDVMVIGSLANYFARLYQLHFLKSEPDSVITKALGLRSSYALREYKQALRNYPLSKTMEVISTLKQYDLMSKGVDYSSTGKDESALLKELVWKILN